MLFLPIPVVIGFVNVSGTIGLVLHKDPSHAIASSKHVIIITCFEGNCKLKIRKNRYFTRLRSIPRYNSTGNAGSLLAAIDLQTGEAIPLVRETHNSADYIDFLKILDEKYPRGDKIRLVLDNLRVHTSEATKAYLATVPGRFEFVFTPKHGSWLNMVEGFFSKMTKQMLRGIRVKSKQELVDRIYLYFDEVNSDPVVFHWKYKMDDIDVSEEPKVDTLLGA